MNAPIANAPIADASALGPIARAGGRDKHVKVSFEFSPPATPEAEETRGRRSGGWSR